MDRTQLTRSSIVAAAAVTVAITGFALSAVAQIAPAQPTAMAKDKVAMEAAFTKADANADGKLSKDELAAMPTLTAKFAELDKNKDGFLSLAEFAVGYTAA